MSIEFACPTCSGTLRVDDDSAGRLIRCGECLTTLRVPDAAAANAAADGFPEPSAAAPSPDDPFGGTPAPLAAAVPVSRPRPRARVRTDSDREPDRDPDRPRRRRRPPPPPGRGPLFWLALVGGLGALLVCLCCGGLYVAVPGAKWRDHRSENGGFKVELPAAPRKDMDQIAGNNPDPNMTTEGTILFRALEEYAIVYGNISPQERQLLSDKDRIDAAVQAMKTSGEVRSIVSQKDITVNGFPGREVEFSGQGGGHYGVRVVVAEGRVYVLVAGGKFTQPGNANVRRFLDSFEITDPALKAAGQKRIDAEQARVAAAERAARARELEEARDGSLAAVRETFAAAEGERREVFRAIEAAARRQRDIGAAGELSTETTIDLGEVAQRAATETLKAVRTGAEGAAAAALAIGERERRFATFVSGPGRYTGRPPELPAEPALRLTFDGTAEQRVTAAPDGKRFPVPAGAVFAEGPSGTALYLPPGTRADLIALPPVGTLTRGSALTVSAWVKTTAPDIEVFRFGCQGKVRWDTLSVRVTGTLTYVQEIDNLPERFAKLSAPSIADGRWHHVAVTREEVAAPRRGEQTTFYVDGKQVGRSVGAGGPDRTAAFCPLALGIPPVKRPVVPGGIVGPGGPPVPGSVIVLDDVLNFAVDEVCVFAEVLSESAVRKLAGVPSLPVAPAPRPAGK
ncbi:LamG domain-containing protein [Gemmata sp. JC673]|uniref:LamG domain-containing protein n=1 Tax=Gemmata algarum TaxID=2975278 RepID=A0ABU5F5I8_9BACT|nr:LamG domain-containing protein [Gemmata algarum]MDY3561146.1 LamG domain-containing protein [Gemmata algarum]